MLALVASVRGFFGVCWALGALCSAGSARASEFENALVYPVDDTRAAVPVPVTPALPRRRFDDDPFNLELRVGWATTVGLIGLVGEYNVADRLALGAGFGTNAYGYDIEAHARFRPVVGVSKNGRTLYALTLEGSLANGSYQGDFLQGFFCGLGDGSDDCHVVTPQQVYWGQLEIGWEMRVYSGMSLRVSAGGATLLGNYHWHCSDAGAPAACNELPARTLISQTVAWGIAF